MTARNGEHRSSSLPYRDREQGSRDWRMLPCALVIWGALLAEHLLFDQYGAGIVNIIDDRTIWPMIGDRMPLIIAFIILVVMIVALTCGVAVRSHCRHHGRNDRRPRYGRRHGRQSRLWRRSSPWPRFIPLDAMSLRCHVIVVVAATLCAFVIGGITDMKQSGDPIAMAIVDGTDTAVEVIATTSTPMATAALRDADCQTDIRVHGVTIDRIRLPSSLSARVYAAGSTCILRQGATYRIIGTLRQPRFGTAPAWLIVGDDADAVTETQRPVWWRRAGTTMQESFIRVTRGLPDYGRVLVPGLTLGVLGQDIVMTPWSEEFDTERAWGTDDVNDVDEAYAQRLEDDFKQAGIMHLMAVSGSHFVLAAVFMRRLCARFLTPRWITAAGIVAAYAMLGTLVYPSDSVLRAAIMGMGGVACLLAGRRSQALAGLNWTVILSLLFDPALARSYGFALSCTAVYGLVLFGDAVERFLRRFMPRMLADTMAVTVSAQILALPVQTMMNPQLPMLAVPANMLVAPFVAFATIAGLLSLCVAWAIPAFGYALAWGSCLGALPIERCATLIGGSQFSVLPWTEGVAGALIVILIETVVFVITLMGRSVIRRLTRMAAQRRSDGTQPLYDDPHEEGEPYRARYMERADVWWRETRAMLFERDVGDVQQ